MMGGPHGLKWVAGIVNLSKRATESALTREDFESTLICRKTGRLGRFGVAARFFHLSCLHDDGHKFSGSVIPLTMLPHNRPKLFP